MGEVYRARDTKLNREVAVKVLPAHLATSPEALARFQREARSLAALNHPHIAQIYGFEEGPSTTSGLLPSADAEQLAIPALVMELVEGPTVADLIGSSSHAQSPATTVAGASASGMVSRRLAVDDAIRIARQVAEALEAAHAAGIVHRDLKPANIKVRHDGVVKVLDFGLARMVAFDSFGSALTADSPTVVRPTMTAQGVIVGTAAYMAPEQARGQPADPRSDMWAFGVVLYEMLSGAPLFKGATVSDVLASVLRDDPRWDALPIDTPENVRRLLRRCLQKDTDLRLRHAGDARLELLDDTGVTVSTPVVARPRRFLRSALLLAALACAGAGGAFVAGQRWTRPIEQPVRKFVIPHVPVVSHFTSLPSISPDGRRVAYVGGAKLRIRALSSLESIEVPVEGYPLAPTWSPDSTALAFVVDETTLWRVQADGGTPSKLCDLPVGVTMGVAWKSDGTVLVNMSQGPGTGSLYTVPDRGGTPRPLTLAGARPAEAVMYLRGLPDGGIVYLRQRGGQFVNVVEGAGKPPKELPLRGIWLAYSPTGHLVYEGAGQQGIWTARFDLATRSVEGEPFRVAAVGSGPTVSGNGILAYERVVGGRAELQWVDRDGTPRRTIGQQQDDMSSPAISPDGTRVAVIGVENGAASVWLHDANRGTNTRLTFGQGLLVDSPSWQDERHITFTRDWRLYTVATDGGEPTPLLPAPGASGTNPVPPLLTPSWARDGRTFAYSQFMRTTKTDVWMQRSGAREPRPVVQTPFNDVSPTLSPDARYVAYISDETGRSELFVRSFPEGSGKTQLSLAGAAFPRWSPRGGEVFFVEGHTLMAVPVRTAPALQVGTPQRLFDLEEHAGRVLTYDTIDGEHFIVVRTLKPAEAGVAVVENWFQEFRTR